MPICSINFELELGRYQTIIRSGFKKYRLEPMLQCDNLKGKRQIFKIVTLILVAYLNILKSFPCFNSKTVASLWFWLLHTIENVLYIQQS